MTDDNSHGANAEAPPRRPYKLIGLVLLVLVVAILVAAFLLDRQFRPRVGIEPSPTVGTKEMPTVIAVPPPLQTTTTGMGAAPAASSTVDATKSPLPAEREVEQAYLKYWDVYADAMLTLDTSRLSEVAAGQRLKQATDEVEQLKRQGKAAKIQVEHKYVVFNVTDKTATVRDEYVNNSYAVDPNTKQPVGTPGKSERIVDSYFLERIEGVWKVVNGVRESP